MSEESLIAIAEGHLERGEEDQAASLFSEMLLDPDVAFFAHFRLGEIANRRGQARLANEHHRRAFESRPDLARFFLPTDHPSHGYVYHLAPQRHVTTCPLCDGPGREYGAYNTIMAPDFIPGFDPVRLWLRCDNCHHLFAANYPLNLADLLQSATLQVHMNPNLNLLPRVGQTVSRIFKLAPGYRMLEVGVGAGEMSAVAREFLFDVTGLDIREAYARQVAQTLGIECLAIDFMEYATTERFDVVCMGDILEHLADPISALRKAHALLNPAGVLWLSTPNFESAFTTIRKDQDAMWRVVEHLQYFSFRSLFGLLEVTGFRVVDYQMSGHYNGSMEVTAVKETETP